MPRYLVLANQTAASPELTNAVREIVGKDADTEFVLLVPATPVEDLLDWQDGDSETIAKRTAEAATESFSGSGRQSRAHGSGRCFAGKGNRERTGTASRKIRRHHYLHSAAAKVTLGGPGISPGASSAASKYPSNMWWAIL